MNSFPGFEENEHGFYCFWTLNNFASYKKKLSLQSDTFTVKKLPWYLKIQNSKNDENYLDLSIHKKCSAIIHNECSFWLLTNNGWKTLTYKELFSNYTAPFKSNLVLYNFMNLPVTDESSENLVNDSLTLAFHIHLAESNLDQIFLVSEIVCKNNLKRILKTKNLIKYYSTVNLPLTLWSKRKIDVNLTSTQTGSAENTNGFENIDDILSLIKETKLSFVTIRTANKDFVVLKALLCARSPVFSAMFNNNMIENVQNAVDIHDVDCDTISSFIQFLHLEPLGYLKWDETVKLFYVADKYQVEILTKQCILLLKLNLCEDNVCESFILADRHDNEDLKNAAIEFFCRNSKNILCSDVWKEFMMNHTSLATEVLAEFATKLL